MSAKNSKFLRDLVALAADFIKYIKLQWKSAPNGQVTLAIDVMDCLTELDIYRLDFSAMSKFFEKSDLVRKLNGFI